MSFKYKFLLLVGLVLVAGYAMADTISCTVTSVWGKQGTAVCKGSATSGKYQCSLSGRTITCSK